VLLRAAKTTSVVLFLVAAALVTSWLITRANIPNEITRFLQPVIDNPKLLMLVIVLLVLVVGTVLDLAPTILILSPVLMPVIRAAGIDPVYFGVIFVMTTCIGLLTPPVGVVLNVVSGVARVPARQGDRGRLALPCRAGRRAVPAADRGTRACSHAAGVAALRRRETQDQQNHGRKTDENT
jgi:TRAP-type C4-dicarboxylate transport system permease large subunit